MGSAAELGSVTSDPDGLKRDAALHLGLITLALAGGSALLGARFDQPLQTSLVALGLFAPIAATVVTRVTAFHPHPSFGLANVVTTVRAALACLLAGGMAQTGASLEPDVLAWSLAALAGACLVLDGLDGYLARRLSLCSPFGARYDMEMDALLIALLAIAAWTSGKAGAWVIASGLLRYGFIAAGWVWPPLRAPLRPSWRRKAVCIVQTAALGLLLTPFIVPPASGWIAALTLALLVWSFAIDIADLSARARRTGPGL